MKNLKIKLSTTALDIVFLFGFTSCSEDSDDLLEGGAENQARLALRANAAYSGATGRSAVSVSKFLLNLEDIELEFEDGYNDDSDDDDYDDYDNDGYVNSDDDLELQGPFEVDVLAGTTFLTIDVPQADYEELSFEFDENENPNSSLYEKTVLIEGSINGTPFEFWYDFEAEAEVDYENGNQNIDINAGLNSIIISFNLDEILGQVDFSQAQDRNDDGIIQIDPENNDGNETLARQLRNALIQSANLEED